MNPGDIWCSACGRYHASLTVCPTFSTPKTYADGIAQGRREIDQAFSMLEHMGIPRERAKTVANGIDVLVTRLHREMDAREHAAKDQGRREAVEEYCKECSCMGPCDRQDTCVQYRTILGAASDETMIGRQCLKPCEEYPAGCERCENIAPIDTAPIDTASDEKTDKGKI
jgi:hypothetical protein